MEIGYNVERNNPRFLYSKEFLLNLDFLEVMKMTRVFAGIACSVLNALWLQKKKESGWFNARILSYSKIPLITVETSMILAAP